MNNKNYFLGGNVELPKPFYGLLIGLMLILFNSEVFAEKDAPSFEAANFKDSELSLQKLIDFPDTILKSEEDLNVVVRCDAFIKKNGKFSSNFCYQGGDFYSPFVNEINRAAKRADIEPGRVNGHSRKVYFQYFVVFMKKRKSTSVEVFPNSGLEVEKYGVDYTSPQRYREGRGKFGASCGFDKDITVKAVIDEKGVPLKVEAEGEGVGEKCKKYLVETFMEQRYIPAMAGGKPVTAFYSELIFDNSRQ